MDRIINGVSSNSNIIHLIMCYIWSIIYTNLSGPIESIILYRVCSGRTSHVKLLSLNKDLNKKLQIVPTVNQEMGALSIYAQTSENETRSGTAIWVANFKLNFMNQVPRFLSHFSEKQLWRLGYAPACLLRSKCTNRAEYEGIRVI